MKYRKIEIMKNKGEDGRIRGWDERMTIRRCQGHDWKEDKVEGFGWNHEG